MVARFKDAEPKIFQEEINLLESSLDHLSRDGIQGNELLQPYKKLIQGYKKLLKITKKTFAISDIQGKILKERESKIKSLLDHSSQGFLTFGSDLLIHKEYSEECERIFNCKIGGLNVLDLLDGRNKLQRGQFAQLFNNIFFASNYETLHRSLDLLNQVAKINDNYILIEARLLEAEEEEDLEEEITDRTLLLILTDITQKRQTEEKMASMSYYDKLKDDFLANVTHELKTPLHGIVGIAESLLDQPEERLKANLQQNLRMIASSGRRLGNLVNDILDFSLLKNKSLKLSKKPINIWAVAEFVLNIHQNLLTGKSIVLRNLVPRGIRLIADEDRLIQIMHNLIGNAVKFTASGFVEVSVEQKGDYFFIHVRDTGVGISRENWERIFEEFEQADSSISRIYGGTGLGLYITKQLVKLHGGQIFLHSQEGKGSTFTFTLPADGGCLCPGVELIPSLSVSHQAIDPLAGNSEPLNLPALLEKAVGAAAVHEAATGLKSNAEIAADKNKIEGQVNILVVDDEEVNVSVLRNYFSGENVNLTIAYDGPEALEKMATANFDLVLLDVMMPRLSGYFVCETIRQTKGMLELPVLMLTARSQPQDIMAGFEAGANDYLTKPFAKTELLARVRNLLMVRKYAFNEKLLHQAEMQALQAQIKPHFLFNTLNVIAHQIRTNPQRARELLQELGELLRSSFKSSADFIPLSEEMKTVQAYLSLEGARLKGRLKVDYDLEPGLNCMIPNLILQPIVENAIKHGLFPKLEGGSLKISAFREGNFVKISIEDDGQGMTQEQLLEVLKPKGGSHGIGISNVRQRLKNLYGQELLVHSQKQKGTAVDIIIPYQPVGIEGVKENA